MHVVKKGWVLLPCKAASPGGEETSLRWIYQDKETVTGSGPRHLVLQDNSLLLMNIRPLEGGDYSCVASNQYGDSWTTAEVFVSSEWVWLNACMTIYGYVLFIGLEVDEFVNVTEGGNVLLTCGEGGGGGGVEWVKDDKISVPTFMEGVVLFDVDHPHQGDYTCSYDDVKLNYYLRVQGTVQ